MNNARKEGTSQVEHLVGVRMGVRKDKKPNIVMVRCGDVRLYQEMMELEFIKKEKKNTTNPPKKWKFNNKFKSNYSLRSLNLFTDGQARRLAEKIVYSDCREDIEKLLGMNE